MTKAPEPNPHWGSLEPGSRLHEHYEILRVQDRSPNQNVYEVLDGSSGRRCVLTEIAQDKKTPDKFALASRLQRVTHPFMAGMVDVFLTDRAICIVSEVLEGEPLLESERPREPFEVVPRILEILEPVSLLHEQNPSLLHAKIEPGAVRLQPATGRARLAPPGLPPALRSSPYDAPELVLESPPTPASDVYSIGVLMAEAIRGEKPTLKPMKSLLISSPDIDLHLATIIDKAVSTEPGRRYASAVALRDELRKWWRQREPTSAPEAPARLVRPAEPGAPARGIPRPLFFAVGALVCLALWLPFRGTQESAPAPSASALAHVEPDITPAPGLQSSSPAPSPAPVEATTELTPTREPEPTPAPTRTALPRPKYPVHKSYPKASPRTRPPGVSTPVEVSMRLARPDLGLAVTVPEGWEVRENGKSIGLANLQPDAADPFSSVTIRVDRSTNAPSRIGRSYRLKKNSERWIELSDFAGADQAYLRGSGSRKELEALVIHRLPYYEYRYVIVHLETQEAAVDQAGAAVEAQRWLQNLQLE